MQRPHTLLTVFFFPFALFSKFAAYVANDNQCYEFKDNNGDINNEDAKIVSFSSIQ